MYFLEQIKFYLAERAGKIVDQKIEPGLFSFPPDVALGELSLPCFKLGGNPAETAKKIAAGFELDGMIEKVSPVGPYVNFKLQNGYFIGAVLNDIIRRKREYGESEIGGRKTVLVEYSNGNTHKECHIGHLRNIAYGDSVVRILAANNYKAVPVSYINDFGIHVAKTLWRYLEAHRDDKLPDNRGHFLGKIYAESVEILKNDESAKEKVSAMMKKIEAREGEEYAFWKKTRKWSIDQLLEIYRELDIRFAKTFYESDFIEEGKKMIPRLIEKGILKRSEGAVIADLEQYDLGVLVFVRSDGTATYPVSDIPLALKKAAKFKPEKSIYVVDTRQALYFRQLFKILELLGQKEEKIHLGYEFVKLPSGMMSSRAGNVITYEELKEKILARSREETAKRHPDWSAGKIEKTAFKIAVGAMKFEMLKTSAAAVITFDIEEALRFDGYTAAYLQYTCARVRSVLRKGGRNWSRPAPEKTAESLKEEKERLIALKLAEFPGVVARAGANYDPSEVARYLFDLARIFNEYYHEIPVLKTEEEIKRARLALLSAVVRTIVNGLGLLGIEDLEEM